MTLIKFPTSTRTPLDDYLDGFGDSIPDCDPEDVDDFRRFDVQGMELHARELSIVGEPYAELVIDEGDDPVGHALDPESAVALAAWLLAWAGPKLPILPVAGARCMDGPRTRAMLAEAHASLALMGLERTPNLMDES